MMSANDLALSKMLESMQNQISQFAHKINPYLNISSSPFKSYNNNNNNEKQSKKRKRKSTSSSDEESEFVPSDEEDFSSDQEDDECDSLYRSSTSKKTKLMVDQKNNDYVEGDQFSNDYCLSKLVNSKGNGGKDGDKMNNRKHLNNNKNKKLSLTQKKKGPWTKEEDENIIAGLKKHNGKLKWSEIQNALPNRSDSDIKNRYHSTLRRITNMMAQKSEEIKKLFLSKSEIRLENYLPKRKPGASYVPEKKDKSLVLFTYLLKLELDNYIAYLAKNK